MPVETFQLKRSGNLGTDALEPEKQRLVAVPFRFSGGITLRFDFGDLPHQ